MKRSKQLALGVVALLLAASAPLWSRAFGRKRIRFFYATGTLSSAEHTKLASRPGWSAASANVASGIVLNGLIRRPIAPGAPWVLFYPGNDPAQLASGQAFVERLRQDRDWGLALFAYRGFDSSSGAPRLEDLRADAVKTLEHLCSTERLEPTRVHLVSFSIGGHLAAHVAAEAARRHKPLASLSLLASVDDIVMVRRSRLAFLDPGDDYQTRPILPDVPAPVVVVQGAADEALNGPQQGRDIASSLGARGRYVELTDIGHGAVLESELAIAPVREHIVASTRGR